MASSKGPFEDAAGLLTDVKNCVYKIPPFPYIMSPFTRFCRHCGFVTFSQNPLLTTSCTHPSQHQYLAPPLRRFPAAAIAPLRHCRNISPLPPHTLSFAATVPLHYRHNTLLHRYFQKNGTAFLRLCTRQRHLITFSDKHAQHRPTQYCTFQILFVILPYTYPTPATRAYSRRHRGGE